MCIDEKFIKVVAQGNSLEIRTYLASHLLLDSKFNDFDEALSYANSKINVLQDDDNKEYEYDSSRWNNEYLARQHSRLIDNFSPERIDHIKKVISYLYKSDTPIVADDKCDNKLDRGTRAGRKVIRTTTRVINVQPIESETERRLNDAGKKLGKKSNDFFQKENNRFGGYKYIIGVGVLVLVVAILMIVFTD